MRRSQAPSLVGRKTETQKRARLETCVQLSAEQEQVRQQTQQALPLVAVGGPHAFSLPKYKVIPPIQHSPPVAFYQCAITVVS
jgi:hypothetical protein